jgi:rhodanese-related sulfurtransferase
MQTITVQELYQLREDGTEHQLIDVREPHEYDFCNIGGELIPLATVTRPPSKSAATCPLSSCAAAANVAPLPLRNSKPPSALPTSPTSKAASCNGPTKLTPQCRSIEV